MSRLLFFDTETTGLPKEKNQPYTNSDNWPRLVQIAWILYHDNEEISSGDHLIYPDGFEIPVEASDIHGHTTEDLLKHGKPLKDILNEFWKDVREADVLIAHNVSFDSNICAAELHRNGAETHARVLMAKHMFCTLMSTVNFCKLPGKYRGYKWPSLGELYERLFNEVLIDTHDALIDIRATAKCYFELQRLGIFS